MFWEKELKKKMPTYNYACESCSNEFEEQQTIENRNAPTEAPCPKCGAMQVKKIVGDTPNAMCDPFRMGRVKPSEMFRDRLREIKKTHNGGKNNVNII